MPGRGERGTAVRKKYVPGEFDLVVRRSKTGLGLFTGSEIPKNACIIEYDGVLLSPEQEARSNSRYLFEVHARKTIDGSPRWNTARYINHSCRPNCEPNIYKGRVFIHARRRIRPGEELSYNYGKNYFNEYLKSVCACPKCKPEKPKAKAIAKKVATRKRKTTAARRKAA